MISTQGSIGSARVLALERRLVEDPESIPTKDLAVVGGIASDKIREVRKLGRPPSRSRRVHRPSLDRLAQLERKIKFEITVEREPAIDVTPSKAVT